jgi:hypothetical protein
MDRTELCPMAGLLAVLLTAWLRVVVTHGYNIEFAFKKY